MKLFKVPSKEGGDGNEPQDWNVIKVVASSDNKYQIEFINKRYYYSDAFVDLEVAVPGFRNMLHSDFINQPNLVDMSTIKGRWLLTCHYCYGSGYESQQPEMSWEVDDAGTAVLLMYELDKMATKLNKEIDAAEYNFHISEIGTFTNVDKAIEDFEKHVRSRFTD